MRKLSFNAKLIFPIILFCFISLISVFSAQKIVSNNLENAFIKQIFFYIIGFIVLIIAYYNKKRIIKYSLLSYLFLNALLLLLLFMGISINGSRCWLIMGPISFQPSEFMKIILIIILAQILSKNRSKKNMNKEFKMLLTILIIILIPSILTFLEPDTGVVLIYFIIAVSMILYRGINKKWYLVFLAIIGLISIGVVILVFYKRELLINFLDSNIFYRMDRLLNWQKQSGYQLENSIITIGSSGLLGFGINKIPLYFPEATTDFIFTTFSSIFGFIGNTILFAILIYFDISILHICKKRIKKSDEYIVIGLFAMIIYQQIQNIGMTIGLLPITGITLPFISYGGSSLLSYMFIVGLILRIYRDNYKYIN